ncbi:MAG: YkgJ family cysteine cluster protein [Planctomycetes bacterium]|nr:YkgJ family cysteine cluster protein [Planctomycetota bacterium]
MNPRKSFSNLEVIYQNLPPVPCISCGLCCVSPHVTLLEFVYLLDGLLNSWPAEKLIALVAMPATLEKRYPGNLKCPCQEEKGLCGIYQHRPLMCRLEGLPVLDRMGIRKKQICPYITEEEMKVEVLPEDIDRWVAETFGLSTKYYNIYAEPYWLSALNLECWLAVALDPKILQGPVLNIRKMVQNSFDLDFLAVNYEDTTQFSEKLDAIDLFFEQAEKQRNPREAIGTILHILNDFPATGSYYLEEGKRYLSLMHKVLQDNL